MYAQTESAFAHAVMEWTNAFQDQVKERFQLDRAFFHPSFDVGERTAKAVMEWCVRHRESASDLSTKLWYVSDFTIELYEALAHQDNKPNTTQKRHAFWSHVDLQHIFLHETISYRDHFLNRHSLKSLADAYLARPWYHNSFLDWVFTDALIAAEAVATYEWFQAQLGGVSYALFDGNKIKADFFRFFVARPLAFLSWIAPGLLCWWLYGAFPITALILGAVYYIVNVAWAVVYFIRRIVYRMRGGKSLRQRAAELIPALFNAYQELRESTVHVPSLRLAVEQAKEKGVAWDPQLFCILDNIVQNYPSTWTAGQTQPVR